MSTRARWRPPASGGDRDRQTGPRASAITLPCLHLEQTVRFYEEGFGLETSGRWGGRVALSLGSLDLVLVDASGRAGYQRGAGQGVYVELSVSSLVEVRARLKALGATVFSSPRTADRLLTAQDPEGNLVNVLARPAGG